MNRRQKVELFEQIRREYEFGIGTIAGVARQLGVHRRIFLDTHQRAFHDFGGVFRRLRYDHLTSAVKKILRGHQRQETTRFLAFRSHGQFEASFCTPAQGHEKGGVEGEVGYFRRNHRVPIPQVASWEELNERLLCACQEEEQRLLPDGTLMVGQAVVLERPY